MKYFFLLIGITLSSFSSYAFNPKNYLGCIEALEKINDGKTDYMVTLGENLSILSSNSEDGDGYFLLMRSRETFFCAFDENHNGGVIGYQFTNMRDELGQATYDHQTNKIVFASTYFGPNLNKIDKRLDVECFPMDANEEMEQVIVKNIEEDIVDRLWFIFHRPGYIPRLTTNQKKGVWEIQEGACEGDFKRSELLQYTLDQVRK